MRKYVSFDWALKHIFRNKANFVILEGFLSELLKDDIRIDSVLESESNRDSANDKSNRLDIKVRDAKERLILIELQYSRELDYLQRVLYASSKAISEQIKKGASYSDVAKVISISILHFALGEGDDYIYHGATSFTGLHSHTLLKLNPLEQGLYHTHRVEDIFPEYYLLRVDRFPDTLNDPMDEWMQFLKSEDIPEEPHARGLQEAKQELTYIKMNEEERRQFERYEENRLYEASMFMSTYETGWQEGKEEGIEEGREEERKQIARTMRAMGITADKIHKGSGLTLEEIEKL